MTTPLEENRPGTAYVTLRSGRRVDLMRPDPEKVEITDIAHALSHICRWGGHAREFYSVAEHSLILSYHVSNPLWGLLHDAAEAYVGDMVRPLKRVMTLYQRVEEGWAEAVRAAFRLPPCPPDLAVADLRLAVTEAEWLYGPAEAERFALRWNVVPLGTMRLNLAPSPAAMRHAFLLRYEELMARRSATGAGAAALGGQRG